jgi:tartrate-resistant acid phosphatase type 5
LSSLLLFAAGDQFYPDGTTGIIEPFAEDFSSSEFLMWKQTFLDKTARLRDGLKSSPLSVPWYVVLGNHDYMGQWEAQIAFSHSLANPGKLWRMPDRNYSFEKNGVAFVCFDANACQHSVRRVKRDAVAVFEKDVEWLKRTLALHRASSRWVVLVQHHPFYTDGRGHSCEALALSRSKEQGGLDLESLVRESGCVDVVVAGHEHMMMAKMVDTTLHVCAGAAIDSVFYKGEKRESVMDWIARGEIGFLSFEATSSELSVSFVRSSDLTVIKTFALTKNN